MKASSHRIPRILAFLLLLSLALAACGSDSNTSTNSSNGGSSQSSSPVTVHLGYFPNITHAVALVGVANGTFARALGNNTLDASKTFNAGPALMEALTAGDIDIGYVGPNPAINTYVTTHGDALRIIAGASSGGASFIVRPGANIKTASDLKGKKLATPQKGGTQDIALRHYLQINNLKTTDNGGDIQILPTDNANILNEFKQGQIDGAWVPEPWASRLVNEANGTIFLDERSTWPNNKFITTLVVVRKDFLDQHPDIVQKFLQAHVETVQYINNNLPAAEKVANEQLKKLTGKALSAKAIDGSFKRLDITYDPLASTLFKSADNAYALGFLGHSKPDLTGIFSLDQLNSVLSSKGLPKVTAS
ncbi:ABC transporter substrate-binding protein [Dictyobacter kobayashii]|uniref:Sulfate ABC transporter substrate-binding protein n=1 Tax=Dictyobacter kobayashii TaxID=2014872 RepID=A0A402APJ6_9CHLR|nr:ABC transporter substrate-binding protein [Dictyobacter kobayashii]GCE21037.1 sulfate ABC transporter substrate-binding protein [Dictyobacter kobayashii]